jgi:hypothetical protein
MRIKGDITGKVYGRLTVKGFSHVQKLAPRSSARIWECECECGNTVYARTGSLTNGNNKSCGCYKTDLLTEFSISHGHASRGSATRTYNIWCSMKSRCSTESGPDYHLYGARGIFVCDEWKTSFENFLRDMGEVPEGKSIDRIDNDKGYCKENCRWATATEQANNRRNNRRIEFEGETKTLTQWVTELDLPYDAVRARLNSGYSIERALSEPIKNRGVE